MELYIYSTMNIQTVDFSTNGEWMGISISYLAVIMIHGVLPLLSLFIISRKKKHLHGTFFAKCAGELYENTKIDKRSRIAYPLVFIIRRFLFLTSGMFILDSNLGGL